MADKSEAEKLLELVAGGGGSTPPSSAPPAAPPAAPAAAPPAARDPARALFDSVLASAPGAQPPAPPPAPPATPLQGAVSPVARGLQALPDLANMVAAGLTSLPSPTDWILEQLSTRPRAERERSRRIREEKGALVDSFLKNTGGEGIIYSTARDLGIVPPDPNWRPSNWLARALYNTTDLMTQIGTAGALSRVGRTVAGAMPTPRAHTMELPMQPPGHAAAAPSSATVPVRGMQPPGVMPNTFTDLMVAPALGGLTGSLANKFAPERYKEVAEGSGMALGAMSPYITLPRAIRSGVEALTGLFRSPTPTDTGRRLAGLVGRHPDELLTDLQRGREMTPTIEGWAPSPGAIIAGGARPGERNSGLSLLGLERREADKPTVFRDPLDRSQWITPAELRARNTQALQSELRAGAPEGDPQLATAEMADRMARLRQRAVLRQTTLGGQADVLEQEAARAQQLVNNQLPATPPGERTQSRAAAAQRLYGALEDTAERNAVTGGALFDAVDPERTARVPMYRIRDALDEVKALAVERGRTDAIPKVMLRPTDAEGRALGDKIDDYLHNWEQETPNPKFLANVPYERVKGLRSRLTTAQRQAVDPQEREFYGRLIRGVDEAVAESAQGTLAERYARARDYWRTNVARPFREGPVAAILRNERDLTGAGTLFASGERGGQNMAQISAQVRADPDLYRSVVDYARADMVAFATNVDGRINGARLKEWVDKHQPVLAQFPELQREFGRVAAAQRVADQWFEQAAERAPALRALGEKGVRNTEDTIRRSAARFYLNAEPEDVVRGILKVSGAAERRRAAEQAMGMLKTREAREGLQRAYYDYVVRRALGGENRVDVKGGWKNTFTTVLDNEAPVAEVLLPQGVRDRMKRLERAASMNVKRDEARANVGSRSPEDLGGADPRDLSVMHRLVQSLRGDLPTTLSGAAIGMLSGTAAAGPVGSAAGAAIGAGGAYLGRHLMMARTAAREAALREALFNPDIFERAMSSASLDRATRARIGQLIRPYVLIANTEALDAGL